MTDQPVEHPGELLTAYLDDEVDAAGRAAVVVHLAACPQCAAALAAERSVAALLAGLPLAAAPTGFYPGVLARGPLPRLRSRQRTRFAAANLAAAAAVWLGVVGLARLTGGPTVRPALGELVSAHASIAGASTNRVASVTGAVPEELARTYRLVDTFVVDGRRQALYTDGERWLSMFLQPGRLDVAALPVAARPVAVDGLPAWRVDVDGAAVVLVQRPGVVVVLVGPGADEDQAVMAEARGKAPEPSVVDRLDAAARGLLDAFGMG